MIKVRPLCIPLFCIVFLLSTIAESQTDRSKLAAEIRSLQLNERGLEQNISDIEAIIEDLQSALDISLADNAKQKQQLAKQRTLTESEPNPANERSLNLIENAVVMSDRGVATQQKRIARQASKLQNLKTELTRVKTSVANKITALAAPETEPEAQEAAPVSSNANTVADNDGMLEVASAQAIVPPSIGSAEPVIAVVPPPEKEAMPGKATRPAELMASVADPDQQPLPIVLDGDTENPPNNVYSPEELKNAKEDLALVNRNLARLKGKALFKLLSVSADKTMSKRLTFVGSDIYTATAALPAGEYDFKIRDRKFTRVVKEAHHNRVHRFIVHARDATRIRLYFYSEALLKDLGLPEALLGQQGN